MILEERSVNASTREESTRTRKERNIGKQLFDAFTVYSLPQ